MSSTGTFSGYMVGKLTFLCFLFIYHTVSSMDPHDSIPIENGGLDVRVTLRINKIYDINTIDESYKIDGYLIYSWKDPKLTLGTGVEAEPIVVFENDRAEDAINSYPAEMGGKKLEVPSLEFINIHGTKAVQNRRIFIDRTKDSIEYKERFFGTFGTTMDYRKFPFDEQCFVIIIESFGYNKEKLQFATPTLTLSDELNDFQDWTIEHAEENVLTQQYFKPLRVDFSRIEFVVKAKRKPDYYLWQVLLPLVIIILASFSIFWFSDFGTQIGVGFTLMLTVVAFNFYSTTILPKLPYNTYIENVIIVGYFIILLGILSAVVNHRLNLKSKKGAKNRLFKSLRIVLPLTFFITMIILYFVNIKFD